MDKKVLDYVVEKTNELISAPSCSSETKASAEEWLAAVGTDREAEATKKYIADLEGDIMPIDMLISFAESEAGAKVFGGAEAAAGVGGPCEEDQSGWRCILRLPGVRCRREDS